MQTADGPLGARHVGHELAWLKARFPQPNIDWSHSGLAGKWWEPHGDLEACQRRIQAFLRTLLTGPASSPASPRPDSAPLSPSASASVREPTIKLQPRMAEASLVEAAEQELIRDDGDGEAGKEAEDQSALPEVAIVTHENVLRVLLGIGTVAHCQAITASLTFAQLPLLADHRFVIGVPHLPHWRRLVAAREFLVMLGCNDPAIQARRARGVIDTAVAKDQPVIVALAVAEYAAFRQSLKEYSDARPLSTVQQNTFVCDIHSLTTECNARNALAMVEAHSRCLGIHRDADALERPLTLRIVTNDWHMPRALMLFRTVAAALGVDATIVALPVATSVLDMLRYEAHHLGEGALLAALVGRCAEQWSVVRRECREEIRVVAFLMRQWAERRRHNGSQDSRDALRDLIKGGDARRADIAAALRRGFQAEQPLALQSLKSGSAVPPIHLAAEVGALAVVADLLLCWGADPDEHNHKGLTAIECARREGHFDIADLLQSFNEC